LKIKSHRRCHGTAISGCLGTLKTLALQASVDAQLIGINRLQGLLTVLGEGQRSAAGHPDLQHTGRRQSPDHGGHHRFRERHRSSS
jgi:hypothetical protein